MGFCTSNSGMNVAITSIETTKVAVAGVRETVLSQCFDGSGQTALVTGGLVLVNDILVSNAINHAGRLEQRFSRSCFVASGDGSADALNRSAQHGAKARIVQITSH